MLVLRVFLDVGPASVSWECGVHGSGCGDSPSLKELINCLSWFSHLEIKRLMEILWNHELEFTQLHYSLKSERLWLWQFLCCYCFFLFLSDASITLKAILGIETVWLHNNKVSAWREKHAAEARITKAKYVCIYMKTNSTQGWPQHRRIRSHFYGKQLNVIKLTRISNLDKNWRWGRLDGSHRQGSTNTEKTGGEHSECQEWEGRSEKTWWRIHGGESTGSTHSP